MNTTRARAVLAVGALGTTAAAPAAAQTAAPATTAAPAASKIVVGAKHLNVRAGRTAVVRGTLRPAGGDRIVRLERLVRGRWRQLDGDLTSRSGRFVLRYRARTAGSSL